MRRGLFIIFFFTVLISKTCLASENVTQIDRYLTISNKPKISQIDLLSQSIQIRFPQNVQTIGAALNYILRFSGYGLVSENQMSRALKITLSKPLPLVDRDMGPMSLKEGITTLVGAAFYLHQDPVNRVVDFRLKPAYQKFITK